MSGYFLYEDDDADWKKQVKKVRGELVPEVRGQVDFFIHEDTVQLSGYSFRCEVQPPYAEFVSDVFPKIIEYCSAELNRLRNVGDGHH